MRLKDELTSNFNRLKNSVVTVWSEFGHGTGFIFDKEGLILTNQHVIGPSEYIAVQFDAQRKIPAVLLASSPEKDVAVLWINLESFPEAVPAVIANVTADEAAVTEGERVFTIGSPLNQKKIITTGIAIKIEDKAILSDININHGNSGGALYNSIGEVVGITTFKDLDSAGEVADALDLNQSLSADSLGIFGKTSEFYEPSRLLELEGDEGDIKTFAALMGVLAPDQQYSVMVNTYSESAETGEVYLTFDDAETAENFIDNRSHYGYDDLSFIPDTNTVLILDWGTEEDIAKIRAIGDDYGQSVTFEERNAEISFIEEPDYRGHLQRARHSLSQYDQGTSRQNLGRLLEQAENKLAQINDQSGEQSSPDTSSSADIRLKISDDFDLFSFAETDASTVKPKKIKARNSPIYLERKAEDVLRDSPSKIKEVLSALRIGKMGSVEEPINNSKGCGVAMRVATVRDRR